MTPIDPVTVVMLGGWKTLALVVLVLIALVCVACGGGYLYHAWIVAGGAK